MPLAMLLVTEVFLALLISVLIAQFLKQRWAMRSLPPGPAPLPFLGNLWTLNFELNHETLMKMAKIYGDIFTVWLGGQPFVIINGYKAVRNALTVHAEELSGRPSTALLDDTIGNQGIIFSNGHTWKQQRRFGMMTMRNLGLGKKSLESHIQDVTQQLLEYFSSEKGKPMDPSPAIINSVTNVITSVIFGHCFSIDDGNFQQLMKATDLINNVRTKAWNRLYDAFPSLMRKLPIRRHEVFVEWEKLREYVKKEIRIRQVNPRDEPQDLIDYYLKQISQTKQDSSSTFTEENLIQVAGDLFLAGSETTTTTLCWAMLYMVNHPEIQKKVQEELDTVLGGSTIIEYEDRHKMPYTNAVIHEIQRLSNIVAVGVVRQCVKETTLLGFHLEKGTAVLPNLSSALYDSEMWETPRKFNPGHFLDNDGNFVINEAFLPFGAGHRVCLGEQLARTELFIFFSSLLRAFTFHHPKGLKIREDYILGAVCKPYPFKFCAILR